MTPVLSSMKSGSSLVVEEHDGHISAFVFKGSIKHIHRVLRIWASGSLVPLEHPAELHAPTGLEGGGQRHWYRVQLPDELVQ